MSKRRISKREAVLLAADRMRDSNTPSPEFVKLVQFVERNSPQWHRKRRRTTDEINLDLVKRMEQDARRKLLEAVETESQENLQ